jgi:hypothetical protein
MTSSSNLESLPTKVVEPWNNGICKPFRKHVVPLPCAESDEILFISFGPRVSVTAKKGEVSHVGSLQPVPEELQIV